MSSPSVPIDLQCERLCKAFGSHQAVCDVTFEIPRGSFFSILGPSGCGKTTLLRMLAGFLEPDAGDIRIKSRSMLGVPPNKRPLNMVFQHLALFPMMSVGDNIGYGLRRRGVGADEIRRRVADVLERVGLPGAGANRIEQLSGGQKQRIALARCLVLEPAVLLLDEPLGALDLKLREQMKIELKQLQQTFGTTFVYITHDQSEAMVMSDRVAVMNHGRFEQVGTPQALYYAPLTPFVAGFVGDSNRIDGHLAGGSQGQCIVTAQGLDLAVVLAGASPVRAGDAVEVFVRPESIEVARGVHDMASDNQLITTVETVLFDGANSRIEVCGRTNRLDLLVRLPQTHEFADLRRGDIVSLGWMSGQTQCFAARRREDGGNP